MSLLREIQEAAIDDKVSAATMLRKAKVLAMRLDDEKLNRWVSHELDGYQPNEPIPYYRAIIGEATGVFATTETPRRPSCKRTHKLIAPSDLPEPHRQFAHHARLAEPIAVCEAMIGEDRSGNIDFAWPPDLVRQLQDDIFPGLRLLAARIEVSKPRMIGIVDAVRNLLLEFVVQLEKEHPKAGQFGEPPVTVPETALTQLLNVTAGPGSIINIAGRDAAQTVVQEIRVGDVESLRAFLASQGIEPADLTELETAIKEDDEPQSAERFGAKVSGWISKMISKAVSGAWKVGAPVATVLLTDALKRHYGMTGD